MNTLTTTASKVAAIMSIVTALGGVVGGSFFVDQRYAHAVEIEKLKQEHSSAIKSIQIENRGLRKAMIEDKVFEIESKSTRTAPEEAQLNRYKRQLDETNREIRIIERSK